MIYDKYRNLFEKNYDKNKKVEISFTSEMDDLDNSFASMVKKN